MLTPKVPAAWIAALAGVFAIAACPAPVRAQADQAVQDQIRILKEKIDQLNKQVEDLAKKQKAAAPAEAAGPAKPPASAEPKFDAFIKGFYGTLDASLDYTTKGMGGMEAFPFAASPSLTGPWVQGPPKGNGAGPFGRVSWMAAMSSNGSNFGYRGSHKIENTDWTFVYQVATALDIDAAPGLRNTWTKSSNTVTGAVGLGDTYIGLQSKEYGRIRFGTLYMPLKTATDRLNPFTGLLGNNSVVIGNTGGDNRVEFGTHMDHVVVYDSPVWNGVSFDVAYSFGQNPDPYNNILPYGSPDCSGSNNPGSGNLFLSCDDGGYNYAYSGDIKFESGPVYLVAAYELHSQVNRSSDGVGSNSPYYNYILGLGPNDTTTLCGGVVCSTLLDWADYQAFAAEFPGAAAAGTPEYSAAFDSADETNFRVGAQYHFDFGLTISGLWEEMHRNLPQVMMFQNERQRISDWLAADYVFNGGADRVAVGWAHAGATVGDPGGQHNFNPNNLGKNQANMVTIAYWHKFDKQLTFYVDAADTMNDGNAHFDIGAGGHGIKTDCHDATHALFIDYSSAGPTTWGGCHPIGVSTGLTYKF